VNEGRKAAFNRQQVRILRVTLLPAALMVGLCVAFTGGSSIAASPFITPGATRAVLREYSVSDLERTLSVNNVKTVTKLVADLNALPLFPMGKTFNCPSDDGHLYRLTFYYPARETESVQIQASGCAPRRCLEPTRNFRPPTQPSPATTSEARLRNSSAGRLLHRRFDSLTHRDALLPVRQRGHGPG
jgi:hypothetical protein